MARHQPQKAARGVLTKTPRARLRQEHNDTNWPPCPFGRDSHAGGKTPPRRAGPITASDTMTNASPWSQCGHAAMAAIQTGQAGGFVALTPAAVVSSTRACDQLSRPRPPRHFHVRCRAKWPHHDPNPNPNSAAQEIGAARPCPNKRTNNILEGGLEPPISSLGGRRLIH